MFWRKICKSKANNRDKTYPYMISVVIAVYNTEKYLAEMLESILVQKQDVLRRYIKKRDAVYISLFEIILVDDGSCDNSGMICDEYAAKYPCIQVIHKNHEGVSVARNEGIKVASGKYITFPDSDDTLTQNVFEECILFFEKNENEISMVTYPLAFFEAQTGDHWTSYRFENGNRILNMMEEWDKPQYFTSASFFKREYIGGKLAFDSTLVNGEDFKFVHQYLFNTTEKIGLVSTCKYNYRRHQEGPGSTIQHSKKTIKYYLSYLQDLLYSLKDESINHYGFFPKYVQYAIMGQLQWRLRSDGNGEQAMQVIGREQYKKYCELIRELISLIEYDVIVSQKHLPLEYVLMACICKAKGCFERKVENKKVFYCFDNKYVLEANDTLKVIDCIEYGEYVTVRAEYSTLEKNVELFWKKDTEKNNIHMELCDDKSVYSLGRPIMYVFTFEINMNIMYFNLNKDVLIVEKMGNQEIIKSLRKE